MNYYYLFLALTPLAMLIFVGIAICIATSGDKSMPDFIKKEF